MARCQLLCSSTISPTTTSSSLSWLPSQTPHNRAPSPKSSELAIRKEAIHTVIVLKLEACWLTRGRPNRSYDDLPCTQGFLWPGQESEDPSSSRHCIPLHLTETFLPHSPTSRIAGNTVLYQNQLVSLFSHKDNLATQKSKDSYCTAAVTSKKSCTPRPSTARWKGTGLANGKTTDTWSKLTADRWRPIARQFSTCNLSRWRFSFI